VRLKKGVNRELFYYNLKTEYLNYLSLMKRRKKGEKNEKRV
jgi:hypothetical protein